MFDIKGFHISASGAIQGHHGPLADMEHLLLDLYQFYTYDAPGVKIGTNSRSQVGTKKVELMLPGKWLRRAIQGHYGPLVLDRIGSGSRMKMFLSSSNVIFLSISRWHMIV